MKKITNQAIADLLAMEHNGPAVTMYIPTHTSASPPHVSENQLRLKNLTHAAAEQLQEQGNDALAKELRQKQEELMDDLAFWETTTRGLLICANADTFQLFHLPMDTEEHVSVSDSFYLAPILGLLHDAQEYYLLTVAQHNPKLFKADMYGLQPTAITLPASVQEGLNIDENNQKSEQSLSAGGSSFNTSGFNGRGGARNPQEEDRARFFRMIDNILMNKADRSLPLILAGIDAETVEYRAHSKYPTILQGTLSGNMEHANLDELFEQTQAIIHDEIIEPKHLQAMEEYQRLLGTNTARTAHDDSTIRDAANQGRVGTLIVGLSRMTRDTVRDDIRPAERLTFPEGTMADAFNSIALAVQNTSGSVVMVNQDAMPQGTGLAAILRY
ncbi:MAG TPA: hypothetical protein VD735_02060 [Candidatus Saccharimonadales bacterium]|nr:hypothetical protein [Candidatus Saccharimonadales bacterium]